MSSLLPHRIQCFPRCSSLLSTIYFKRYIEKYINFRKLQSFKGNIAPPHSKCSGPASWALLIDDILMTICVGLLLLVQSLQLDYLKLPFTFILLSFLKDHSACFSDCLFSYVKNNQSRTYDFSNLSKGGSLMNGPSFTAKGTKFFHFFNISLCGNQVSTCLSKASTPSHM